MRLSCPKIIILQEVLWIRIRIRIQIWIGSGSGWPWIRILIRIRNADPDPGEQKLLSNIEKNISAATIAGT